MLKMKGKGIVNSYSSKTQHPGLEGPIKASTLQFVAMHKIEGKNCNSQFVYSCFYNISLRGLQTSNSRKKETNKLRTSRNKIINILPKETPNTKE